MRLDEVTAILEKVKDKVSSRVKAKIMEILDIAYSYNGLGSRFTFDVDKDFDKQVNRILVELSDSIIEDTKKASEKVVDEEDKEMAFFRAFSTKKDKDFTERIDSHCSHLKFVMEGFLAVCFAKKLTKGEIMGDLTTFLSNPYGFRPMKDAFKKQEDYQSNFIRSNGYRYGKGINTNPMKGLVLTSQEGIMTAYQSGIISEYRRNADIIGYRVFRGSSYDCDICDELCIGIHPLSEIVLPAHPRCRCYTEPVFRDEYDNNKRT